MLFYNHETQENKNKYKEYLQIVGSLSNLFSDSNVPYLYYRIAEKMFCKAFLADDLSRADVSYDAYKNTLGIGLKTFLKNNDNTIQKIAEFNKDLAIYKNKNDYEKIKIIAQLRNKRLDFTNNIYGVKNSIYHCVLRDVNKFYIYEEQIKPIDISNIKLLKQSKSSISFEDGNYEYSFSLSKSTLLKRFETKNFLDSFDISILKDPLDELYKLNRTENILLKPRYIDTAYLPLYGSRGKVYENSGLNQWNAKGRIRDKDEIYIPIPKKFYKIKPNFFPQKDVIFSLNLPNKKILQAKICQDNSKALMSNPNKDLGKWLLRDILKLKDGQLVTNELLKTYDIDSVRIDKISENEFDINFTKTGSFEKFYKNNSDKV